MKYKILLLLSMMISAISFAQVVNLSGTVKDEATGFPIMDVSVTTTDSGQEVFTDEEGNFYLENLSPEDRILISGLGYEVLEYQIGEESDVQINLKQEGVTTLNDVVVIGYGAQVKKEITGAVGVVDNSTIETLKPVKVEQALQGTVSGVNVTGQSGAPGSGFNINIRGIATNGVTAPTVIIDGFIGDMSTLNPSDIENITVLKDAQAAIYGTIGANGVILVTTKKGRKNKSTSFEYNAYYGVQETSRKLPLLNATEYALMLNESYANGGQDIPFPEIGNTLGAGTDWQDEVFSLAPIMSHDLNISGGGEKIAYVLSGSNLEQEGIVGEDKSGFNRNTARIALNVDLTERLTFSTNINYVNFNRRTLNENGLGSVLFNALNAPPTVPVYNDDGTFFLMPNTTGIGNEVINPLAQIANTYNQYTYRKFSGNLELNYDLFTGFDVTGRVGFNSANDDSRSFSPIVDYGGTKVFNNPRSSVTQFKSNFYDYTFDLFANYNKSFGNHDITVTAGTTFFRTWGDQLSATGFDVPNNSWDFADISLTTGVVDNIPNGAYNYDNRRLSYFGRLQYDFMGKYLLSAMIRRDESTLFAEGNRVEWFPSLTAGWIVSDEGFFGDDGFVNFLKLRGSWGQLGNDQVTGTFRSLLNGEGVYVIDGAITTGTAIGAIANENMKWETAEKLDFGLDMNFFNNRLSLVADYFIDIRKDLLINNIPISGIIGIGAPGSGAPTLNAGTVENRGFEFALNYKQNFADDWSISVGYNATFIENEVTEVNNSTGFMEGGAFGVGQPAPSRMEVGQPMGYFYGYQTDGIFQNQSEVDNHADQTGLGSVNVQPGDLRYVDQNGDGVINIDDRVYIGDPIPDATMGFNLQLNYKGIDFSSFVFASIGNDMVRNYERALSDINRLDYVLDRWHGAGTSNEVPRVTTGATNNYIFSDYYVEDASYARIQNVQLGYSFSERLLRNSFVQKLRIYAAVNNLYTFTKYKGYDPGASASSPIGAGIDYGFYPIPRTYMMGINVKF
ncbi:SusC/RagA family TonB-linked outer membrane protein [Moheibacter lacus]|uniref:TonB-dependent receptor n=1 Tax=Moheibacter lacus TaxID=2745851 RepID=A0A838ZRX7_9FLAO|nr:TonB-dependent receptor [Moheibacter lacus]MBA5629682.1 TonB-dependent receptor [Moheibacter lacus]